MKKLKNIIALTLVLSTITLMSLQPANAQYVPATLYKGKVIASQTLPMITVNGRGNKLSKPYTLPMVTIVASRPSSIMVNASSYKDTYIPSVNLPAVTIQAARKNMPLATVYKMVKYFSGWI